MNANKDLPAPLQALVDQENLVDVRIITDADSAKIDSHAGRVDIVFIDTDSLNLEKADLMALIAHCRDVASPRVLARIIKEGSEANHKENCITQALLSETDFLSLGFHRCAETLEQNNRWLYYLFDIKTYKPAPDWLNPRFWANPAMWNKHRW